MQDLSLDRSHGRRLATQQWCIAKPNLQDANYQGALDWACGPLSGQGQVNCGPIQPGQSCYLPNTYQSHASWAFNAYYQTHGQTAQACDFQGTAVISTTDPSELLCRLDLCKRVLLGCSFYVVPADILLACFGCFSLTTPELAVRSKVARSRIHD